MENPSQDIRRVVRELAEPASAEAMLAAVDKYFTPDAQIVYPVFNSPKASGREGVKAGYKMLRVLSYGNKIEFHAVAFDQVTVEKGLERMKGFLDFTEHLKVRFFPVPDSYNPWFHFRFITRIDLVKNPSDGKWYVEKQEDNLPTDFGSTGLHFLPFDVQISNAVKWATGTGTLLVGGTLAKLKIL
ncbi:hypothetical protein JCM10207_009035 [Rhodosporidiobolus poonsookiae]